MNDTSHSLGASSSLSRTVNVTQSLNDTAYVDAAVVGFMNG